MKRCKRYGRLEAIEFGLTADDIVAMLKKAGEIPEGFVLDWDAADPSDWPVLITVKRYTADSAGGDGK